MTSKNGLAVPILQTFEVWLKNESPKVLPKSPIGKSINYAITHYDCLCRYVIDGRYRIDTNLCQERAASSRTDAQELPLLQKPRFGRGCGCDVHNYGLLQTCRSQCRSMADVLLDHVHEYDNDYSLDIADFLPSNLVSKGLLKASENPRYTTVIVGDNVNRRGLSLSRIFVHT